MKAFVLFLIALATVSLASGADAPSTLKEVFAQERVWQIAPLPNTGDPFSSEARRKINNAETALVFLNRVADGRSDASRKNAAVIAKLNWDRVESVVLKPAEVIDAPKAKSLRKVLERIAAAEQAHAPDQAELKSLLATLPR